MSEIITQTNDTINFSSLGIENNFVENLKKNGITEPTTVQEKVIPAVASGKHILFKSETGTGKTLAYLLPLLQLIDKEDNSKKEVKLLIAAPTYELASQIKIQLQAISDKKAMLCIGGSPIKRQLEQLKDKPEIIIGSSNRILELIHLKKLKTAAIKAFVLDEADRLLAPELRDDTCALLERLPFQVQIIGCSATVSKYTQKTLEKAAVEAKRKHAKSENRTLTAEEEATSIELIFMPPEDVLQKHIQHWALFAERRDKISTLRSFLYAVKPEKLIVFSSRTDQVENIASQLRYKKIECSVLHSKTDKVERKSAIDRFRSGKTKILITSDLASRGLDIPNITHVIQMDLPENEDFFIHRAGRTARAGKEGINIVIGDGIEMERYAKLEKKLHIKVYPKVLYFGKLTTPEEVGEIEPEDSNDD
ncbi:MAG: DEAD/DEAH box helicase [Treponema sp.]|nr:DEAD/DEAH box helicase [Treponema sp.]